MKKHCRESFFVVLNTILFDSRGESTSKYQTQTFNLLNMVFTNVHETERGPRDDPETFRREF